ncbi:hypothetical protein, partial [Draconibacterium sp.]|uniref:hypothetical protein n=1 Tax=Draconibacterium sp. TaxID=1965318 RepID=UPI00356609C5
MHSKILFILAILLFISAITSAQSLGTSTEGSTAITLRENNSDPSELFDSLFFSTPIIHRLGVEMRPGYILPTNPYFKGENSTSQPVRSSFSTHLKYSFR